jgi:hypothetical protein
MLPRRQRSQAICDSPEAIQHRTNDFGRFVNGQEHSMKRRSMTRTAKWAVFCVLLLLLWRLANHVPHQFFRR